MEKELQVSIPVMTRERFAALVGVEEGVVRGWIDKGYLPTLKVGKHRLVNLSRLHLDALETEDYR